MASLPSETELAAVEAEAEAEDEPVAEDDEPSLEGEDSSLLSSVGSAAGMSFFKLGAPAVASCCDMEFLFAEALKLRCEWALIAERETL